MAFTFTSQSFESLNSSWANLRNRLTWGSVFVLPCWLKVWWQEFGDGRRLHLWELRENGEVIGIAPLLVKEGKASFIGSDDVCDYLDFVTAPGRERAFFASLLDHLEHESISELHLDSLRDDSTVMTILVDLSREKGYNVSYKLEGVSLDLDLPSTWEEYLEILTPKQRREVGRKLRRLHEAGDINYRSIEGAESVQTVMDIFLRLLRASRKDKAAFMTSRMERFFRSIAQAMAEVNLFRFGVLELDMQPVSAVMCFDYNDTVYLYNSGFDTRYGSLSVGLLSKVFSIKDSIERGRKRYDFLKGAEEYKYRLGGREIPVYSCRVVLQ